VQHPGGLGFLEGGARLVEATLGGVDLEQQVDAVKMTVLIVVIKRR